MNQHALFAAEEETHRIQIAATCGHIVFMDFSVRMAVEEIGEQIRRMESPTLRGGLSAIEHRQERSNGPSRRDTGVVNATTTARILRP